MQVLLTCGTPASSLGDWLDPAAPPENAEAARTDPAIVATAYLAHSAELLGRTAGILGRDEDERHYLALAQEVRQAFRDEYVTARGRIMSDAETAYALALQFGLLEDDYRRRLAGKRLAAIVRQRGYRIGTGFVGTPLICDALCSVGEVETAYRLLLQQRCPSWLYPVTMGATTVWERWDSLRPDGTVNPGEMTSFNHYALGAVADWLHRSVAGLAPALPGYRRAGHPPTPRLRPNRRAGQALYPLRRGRIVMELGRRTSDHLGGRPAEYNRASDLSRPKQGSYRRGPGHHRWSYAYDSGHHYAM